MLEEAISIPVGKEKIKGAFIKVKDARGLVICAYASGSSRRSFHNQLIAKDLRKGRLATLLFDLLTAREEGIDDINGKPSSNISILSDRLDLVVGWAKKEVGLDMGIFAENTAAAAALASVAKRKQVVKAVVSIKGRLELVIEILPEIITPTLLIVDSEDVPSIQLNEKAYEHLNGIKELKVVEGTTYLLEGENKMKEVAKYIKEWFEKHL